MNRPLKTLTIILLLAFPPLLEARITPQCKQSSMDSPLDLTGHAAFQNFELTTDFVTAGSVLVKRNADGLLELDNDFGVLGFNMRFYSLYKIVFVRKSETRISGKQYPFEMQIHGRDRKNQDLVVSVLFETSSQDNMALNRLGIGHNRLREVWKEGSNQQQLKLKASFSLSAFLPKQPHFYSFKGKTTEYPCKKGTWLVLDTAQTLSSNQLDDFPVLLRFNALGKKTDQVITQNIKKGSHTIKLSKLPPSQAYSAINTVSLPSGMIHELVFEPRTKAHIPSLAQQKKEIAKARKGAKILKSSNGSQKRAEKDEIDGMFNSFEIYRPENDSPWGAVPMDAVMPWEVKMRKRDHKIVFVSRRSQKIQSPLSGFKYIALFYWKTKDKFRIKTGKYVYVPYLVLVRDNVKPLRVPVTKLEIYDSGLKKAKTVVIRRENLKLHTGSKLSKKLSAMDIIAKSRASTSREQVKKGKGIKVLAQTENPFSSNPQHRMKALELGHDDKMWIQTMKLKKKQEQLKELMDQVMKNHRRYTQKKRRLKKGQEIPDNGGFDVKIPKKKSKNQVEIERLQDLLEGTKRASAFLPAITTATTTYPLTALKPGQIPRDGIPVFKTLPQNSTVLRMDPPLSPVVNSKYIVYYYGPAGYKSRWGETVYVPNYLLVAREFGLSVKETERLPHRIPVFEPTRGSWKQAKMKNFKAGHVSLSFKQVCVDQSVLKLPKNERASLTPQKNFNIMIWKQNRPLHTDKLLIHRNNKKIAKLLTLLGQKMSPHKPVRHRRATLQKKKSEKQQLRFL